MRRFHRLAGLTLALPLVVWMVTGLLFHVKHRYDEAYEPLAVPFTATPLYARSVFSPAMLQARGHFDADKPVTLATHAWGLVAYFGQKDGRGVAVDSASGDPIPVASEATARLWAKAALAASKHTVRYGGIFRMTETRRTSALTGAEGPTFVFETTGGKRITVDRVTGELSQTGDLNSFVDLTYKLHYLQWTPWKPVNIALVLLAMPLVLFLAFSGLRMALRSPVS